VYQNGVLKASQTFDGNNAYNNTYLSPYEQQAQGLAQQGLFNSVQGLNNTGLTPDSIEQRLNTYKQPQITALNESMDNAYGRAAGGAAGNGMQDSAGFQGFVQNQIERNRGIGLAGINADAEQMRYQLPAMAQVPYSQAAGFYGGILSGGNSQSQSFGGQGQSLSDNLTQFNLQRYPMALSRWQNSASGLGQRFLNGLF
jgi:hypothetical protein